VHLLLEVDARQQVANRLGADAGAERAAEALVEVTELGVGQDLLRVQALEVRACRLDLLLQGLELTLDRVALRLGGSLDLRLERLLVRVEPLLGPLLRGL